MWPQVCGTLGWSGLAAFLLILFVWQLGAAWSILAAAVSIIFTVLYSSMKSAYNTLTLNGEVFHIAITRNNSAVAVQVPGILWTIPVVFLMLVAVYFVHPATDEIPAMPDSDTETDYAVPLWTAAPMSRPPIQTALAISPRHISMTISAIGQLDMTNSALGCFGQL